jgi:hypothetical protein
MQLNPTDPVKKMVLVQDMEVTGPASQRAYLRDIAFPPHGWQACWNNKRLEAQEGGFIKNPLPPA